MVVLFYLTKEIKRLPLASWVGWVTRDCDIVVGQMHGLRLLAESWDRTQTINRAVQDVMLGMGEDVVLYDKCNSLVHGANIN